MLYRIHLAIREIRPDNVSQWWYTLIERVVVNPTTIWTRPRPPEFRVNISKLYDNIGHDFLNRAQLQRQPLQVYVISMLQKKLYDHHEPVYRQEISISQMSMNHFLLRMFVCVIFHRQDFTELHYGWYWASYMKQELLTVRAPSHSMLVIVVVLCVVYFALFVFIPCLVRNVAYVCIVHSWLPVWFSLTFI